MKSSVLRAISLFEKAGREVEGGEAFAKEIWDRVLFPYNNTQIDAAADLALRRFPWKTMRPSHLVQVMESETFQGAGKAKVLDVSKLQTWNDEEGRPFAYSPEIKDTWPRQS